MKKAKERALKMKRKWGRTFVTSFGMRTSLLKQRLCKHKWELDGQTYTAVRNTCGKCGVTELR